jgi:GT2 family glycosyltransferase
VFSIVRAFAEHPDVDVVGGRVLPIWPAAPPAWLTREHWTPLALVDHGDRPFIITEDQPLCLVGANLACRRAVFDRVGLFATEFQRVKDGIGSLEDHDFQLRLRRLGGKALYDPRITIFAEVQPNRLQRAYHRRWHAGHGHFYALLRAEEVERTDLGTLFGVPAHLYRQALSDVIGWLRASLLGRPTQAFGHEVRLHFFRGFLRTRRRERLTPPTEERKTSYRVGVADERLAASSASAIDPRRR